MKVGKRKFLEAVSTETMLDAYRELVGDLLMALAGTCARGRRVVGVLERLNALAEPAEYECGGPWAGVAMEDFARGTNASARFMRLIRAQVDRQAQQAGVVGDPG